jgi:hypothetical protein
LHPAEEALPLGLGLVDFLIGIVRGGLGAGDPHGHAATVMLICAGRETNKRHDGFDWPQSDQEEDKDRGEVQHYKSSSTSASIRPVLREN